MFPLANTPITARLADPVDPVRSVPCRLVSSLKSMRLDDTLAVVAATGTDISVHTLG